MEATSSPSERPDRNLAFRVAFDGTDYSGWQLQAGPPTVQGALERALERVTNRPHRFTASSSRTDAGVHALSLIANVFTDAILPADRFRAALNAVLPPDIRVTGLTDVPRGFNARREANAKTYCYLIRQGTLESPFWRRWSWHRNEALSLEALRASAPAIEGIHDFSAFSLSKAAEADSNKRIFRSEWNAVGPWLCYVVTGDGFLRGMVRRLVGAQLAVAVGRLGGEALKQALSGDMALQPRIFTAPARGLWLAAVHYPPEHAPAFAPQTDGGLWGMPPPLVGEEE